jgi:hypothetical protein
MAHDDVSWSQILIPIGDYGFRTFFIRNDVEYQSVYIKKSARGKGKVREAMTSNSFPFITVQDCGVINLFKRFDIYFYESKGVLNSTEYRAIEKVYGDTRTARSNVFLMNHIDEGLAILSRIGATDAAKKAYCLHPLLQNDTDLAENYQCLSRDVSAYNILLAMEYRNIANNFLSDKIDTSQSIQLSPLKEVNDMLIADKVQNRKDFIRYHKDSHERSKELDAYFTLWLQTLGITEHKYQSLTKDLYDR